MPLNRPTYELAKQDPALRTIMREYMNSNQNTENFAFVFTTESNQVIYNKYIKLGAPQQVNVPASIREPLDTLAEAGQWDQMAAPMAKARTSISGMASLDVLSRFASTDEYKRWHVNKYKKPTDEGAKALIELTKSLKSSKNAATLKALMLVVEGGRTATDRKAAFTSIKGLLKDERLATAYFRRAKLDIPV